MGRSKPDCTKSESFGAVADMLNYIKPATITEAFPNFTKSCNVRLEGNPEVKGRARGRTA